MVEVLGIITNFMVCAFCISGYNFFYEASVKLKREREFLENAKNIQKLLSELKAISPEERSDEEE